MELLLVILPAIFLFGVTIYIKNVDDGLCEKCASKISWGHSVSAACFFTLGYTLRFFSVGS
jgi:hypothetical protein